MGAPRGAPFRLGSRRTKNMRFRGWMLALALLSAPLAAEAQPFHGLYVGAGAGYNLPENDALSTGGEIKPHGGFVGLGSVGYAFGNGFRNALSTGGEIKPHGGFVGLGSVGYAFGNGFRVELEGNYREAPLNDSNAQFTSSG